MTPREEDYGTRTIITGEKEESLGEKSPAELEMEINQIRAEMDSTLSAIERKFSPGELLDRTLHSLKGGPSEYAVNLGRTVRDHPIPTALVGIGLGWLFLAEAGTTEALAEKTGEWKEKRSQAASRTKERFRERSEVFSEKMHRAGARLHDIGEKARGKRHEFTEKAGGMRERLTGKTSEMRERLTGKSSEVRESLAGKASGMREKAQQARGGFGSVLHEQPWMVAAIGVAIGVLAGVMLPVSRKEKETLGETRAEILSRGRQVAQEQAEKARQVAAAATEAAREETERQLH